MRVETEASSRSARQSERRIGWLTLGLGGAAAAAALLYSRSWGAGLAAGTLLAWLNMRWLQQALDTLVESAVAQRGGKPRVSRWAYLKFFGRYALIALAAYVMVTCFAVPVVSILTGLLALGAATIVEGIRVHILRAR